MALETSHLRGWLNIRSDLPHHKCGCGEFAFLRLFPELIVSKNTHDRRGWPQPLGAVVSDQHNRYDATAPSVK